MTTPISILFSVYLEDPKIRIDKIMHSYAILGATGQTGRNLLSILSKSPDCRVNVYVRSKAKLLGLFPNLETNDNVQIFAGDLNDTALIASCIGGVGTVFATVATNENTPNLRIAQDTAQSIVAALCHARAHEAAFAAPQIIVLSSASLNHHLCRDQPAFAYWLIHAAFSNVYADLALAESYLRLHSTWLKVTFIQPGGLVEGGPNGHAISCDSQKSFLSYGDLAAGMVEVADAGAYDWMGVSIVPTGAGAKMPWQLPFGVAKGLLIHFIPWSYTLLSLVW
ncbi:MAG: hypothetical protein M1837_005663 [Sclerophora amabilis]|nr:MAG: hypothetical protein M1837_005663 [Sclerophora amabilis]